jgi:glycosyltransferase involved in cell wall biosynthesis
MTRPRVLMIGRMLFSPHLRVREAEIARALARRAEVFALDRSDAMPLRVMNFADKLRMRTRLWNTRFAVIEEGPVTRFRMRIAGATGPLLNRLAARHNNGMITRAAARFGSTHVVISNPFFFLPPPREKRPWRVHFDLVDNFHDEWPDTVVGRSRKRFLREALIRCESLSACSHGLCELAARLTGRNAAYAPNGAPLERLRNVPPKRARALRAELGLEGRFVLGFIGNHNMPFDGMARLIEAFTAARANRSDLALLIVGPGSDKLTLHLGLGPEQGVHAVGPVPPDNVAEYFAACDAGVHPYDPSPLTHDATPLNVIEFSAAGKPVLANPLRELQRLALPNVRFTRDESPDAWAQALADAQSFAPIDQSALAGTVEAFDWTRSADAIAAEMGL